MSRCRSQAPPLLWKVNHANSGLEEHSYNPFKSVCELLT